MATTTTKKKDTTKTTANTTTQSATDTTANTAQTAGSITGKSQQDYYADAFDTQMGVINTQYETKQNSDATYLEKYGNSLDTMAKNTAAAYQQQIDAAPAASRALYDANAIDEMINRKKVQESMANMGTTDSGLNSSMQTALAIQKSNADQSVRQQEREYVQSLERAIADMWAETEAKKQLEEANIYKATEDWYTNASASAANAATQSAADNYATDVGYLTAAEDREHEVTMLEKEAELEQELEDLKGQWEVAIQDNEYALAEKLKGQIDATEVAIAGINASTTNTKTYTQLYTDLLGENYSDPMARAIATVMTGGTGDEAQDAWNTNFVSMVNAGYSESYATDYANAIKSGASEVDAQKIATINQANTEITAAGVDVAGLTSFQSSSGSGFFDFFTYGTESNKREDSRTWLVGQWSDSISEMIKDARKNVAKTGLSAESSEIAVATAVGKAVRESNTSEKISKRLGTALEKHFSEPALSAALSAAGVA